MPEPELSGALRPESDTGGGDTSQYSVIDDICVTQQLQSEILAEITFDAYGSLFVRDPGFSGQRGAGLSHTRERQGISTCTVLITGDIMFREDARSSPASQQQPVVRDLALSDGREWETGTPGPVSGARPEESGTPHGTPHGIPDDTPHGTPHGTPDDTPHDTPHDTDSVSSSVTCTPPRHKPFILDPQRQVYLT